ncbi:helix-turn-helix domain-containing protein [Alsobacter sp. SYSU M60028]|uniref:Helix-turn-helix domain-containing protein n=1 Tax=Alsobacter ponti TaxID=2962936 RepID=A0ABT1L996_9HYPH|nr:helix-turn-helix domain-containing protein [Alsobacter ponti]MCP8938019.1 helix-turn-helix domain-containing protein [Alsobacter ponti]
MRPEDVARIKTLPLFKDANEDTLRQVASVGFVQVFPSGVMLQEQGTRPDSLYVVIEGSVEVAGHHRGVDATVEVIRAPLPVVLSAVIADEALLASVTTLTRSTLLMTPAQIVRNAMTTDVGFAAAVARELSDQCRRTIRELHNQKLRTATERLANWVLAAHLEAHESEVIELPFKKRVLASLLGSSPESLSRNISALERHGVAFEGSRIRIADRDALFALACPTPLIDAFTPETAGMRPS